MWKSFIDNWGLSHSEDDDVQLINTHLNAKVLLERSDVLLSGTITKIAAPSTDLDEQDRIFSIRLDEIESETILECRKCDLLPYNRFVSVLSILIGLNCGVESLFWISHHPKFLSVRLS